MSAEHGLILVDTRYEFGKDSRGNIILCDEIHTPDSSRNWLTGGYERRFAAGEEPDNIDKEFLCLWFRERCDPYSDEVLPTAPDELIVEPAGRHIHLYETITGLEFIYHDDDVEQRIKRNLSLRQAINQLA